MMDIQELFENGMDRWIPNLLDFPDGFVFNLGAGNKAIWGAIPLDLPDWDANKDQIPAEDGTVAGLHAYHFLEHLNDPIFFLVECQRALMVDGVMNICVPYYRANCAWQDLSHKHFFTEDTWKNLFQNPYYSHISNFEWKFDIHFNMICGVVERNLCLLTQLVRTE